MVKQLLFFFALLLLMPLTGWGQGISTGGGIDSFTVRFTGGTIANYVPDTATIPLWQMGRTHKSFFTTDTADITGIMTDTLHHYPVNANNWFVVKIPRSVTTSAGLGGNVRMGFWHKYQADSAKDGGMVEFSVDAGVNWQNVKGPCNIDTSFSFTGLGVLTSGFYTFNDTLMTGSPAFTGTSEGTLFSQVQFMDPRAEKTTIGSDCHWSDTFYVRFRFTSDTTADTLAGWIIDSMEVTYFLEMGGAAPNIKEQNVLRTFPNPSINGVFSFPPLANEERYTVEVYNSFGERVLSTPYRRIVELNKYPPGLYFYKVTDGTEYYNGQLLYY